MMSKTVGAFVWNHFTNDARVLRECTALSEAGYTVDLFCIHDHRAPGQKKVEKVDERFTVYRVNQSLKDVPALLRFPAVWMLLVLFLALAWFLPVLWLAPVAAIVLLPIKKWRVVLTRLHIIAQMILMARQKRYDIYHSNDLNTLPQGVLSAKLFRNSKLLYDSHEVQTSRTGYNSSIYGKMERFLLRYVDTMMMENHTRAKYIEERYGFYPEVIHNYPFKSKPENLEPVDLHAMLDIPREEPILYYQGGVQTGRGLDKIVEAVPLFKRGVVVFVGDGRIKPELERMVAERNLGERVKFIPKVPLQELPRYTKNGYLGFQVLNNVCFNHYSASSNKLFEYLMSGVPVVACSFPEIQKVVDGEQVGVCVDSHDPVSIAEGVNALLDDEERRNTYAANCLVARNKYNWEEEKELFLDIYQRTLGSTGPLFQVTK
ncbi:MAG: glycosyltransferase [Bacilli bacterium]